MSIQNSYQQNQFQERRMSEVPYLRPKQTKTDKIQTKKSILEKLKDYEEVDDITKVPLNTHIRYIVFQNGKSKFRLGGFLKIIKDEYLVLSNGKVTWSVQRYARNTKGKIIHKTRFFKIITNQEKEIRKKIKDKKTIEKQNREIKKLKKLVLQLSKK